MTKYAQIADMDKIDACILEELQRDNRQSAHAIGEAVGLSEPAIRRRIKALRATGVIVADVSLLDPAMLGGITVIISIRLVKESRASYDQLKKLALTCSEITQCYTVTGDDDFILIGNFSTMARYDDWVNANILTNEAISRSTTNVVYRRFKFDTALNVDLDKE